MSKSLLQHANAPLQRLFLISLFLLTLLPSGYAAILTWHEYFRLLFIALGLAAYTRWASRPAEGSNRRTGGLIALGLIFAITQFDPATSARAEMVPVARANVFFLISSVLVVLAFVCFLLSRHPWGKLTLVDWIVIGAIVLSLGLFWGSYLLFNGSFPWHNTTRFILYGLLWFTVTRGLPSVWEKRFMYGLPVVFGLVCVVGTFRIGTAVYHHWAGNRAQKSGNMHEAIAHFETAATTGRMLRLDALRNEATFAKAEILYKQGKLSEAAQTLSMEEGFVLSIPADAWEGPNGGMLYTNISCWKDVILYQGRVEVRIFARGDPALGIWPLMRVKLGGNVLGEVEVNTGGVKPYTFETQIGQGSQRLDVAFTNDYYNPPENRNLWIEQAEIRYLEITWK